MKAAILVNMSKKNAFEYTSNTIKQCEKLNIKVLMQNALSQEFKDFKNILFLESFEQILKQANFVISLGGDGTLIHNAKHAAKAKKPIIGINLGQVGFISGIEPDEINLLANIKNNNYKISSKMMLKIKAGSNGKYQEFEAINDVVVVRDSLAKILNISLSCDSKKILNNRGDGIIISTQVGSTAYNFSSGGPVVYPNANCLVFTPICPHELFSRSIIFDENSKLILKPELLKNQFALLNIDGNNVLKLQQGAKVKIEKSKQVVDFIQVKDKNMFDTINKKLGKN